jgi:hypothetical protein
VLDGEIILPLINKPFFKFSCVQIIFIYIYKKLIILIIPVYL